MAQAHIARIMHDSLYRGVRRDDADLLQLREEFFVAKNKTYTVNLLAYALGHLPPTRISSLDQWERSDQLVADSKLRQSLSTLVSRMPTLEFQLIPLVLMQDDRLNASFLLRVRKAANAPDCVYLDLTNRLYDQFEQFLTANKLPPCTLWYPADGLLQYKCTTTGQSQPSLVVQSVKITHTSTVWQELMMTGGAVASLFAFTAVGAAVAIPLTFIGSVYSVTNLVDSCKHEPASGVARSAFALTLNLTTFATVGLTAACRVEKLRRLVPFGKLQQLERAEQLLAATVGAVTTGSVITSVLGTVGGYQSLSNGEWMEVAALLCFAQRECFNETNAVRLFGKMQWNGVFNFFRNLCPNVPTSVLRTQLTGTGFERLLQLVMEFLAKGVKFTVDDSFITISLFNYEFKFNALFHVDWSQLRMLLLFLQSSKTSLCDAVRTTAGQQRWTQHQVDDVVKLLQIVSQLRDVSCTLLANYITLGRGHRFSLGTVRAFFTAVKSNRLELLRQLASLDEATTAALNALRESGHISGGDRELFIWLANHNPSSVYTALTALLSVHAHSKTANGACSPTPITFEHDRIVAGPLLALSAADFLKVPNARRDILLHDDRFLRLAADADRDLLLPRATAVWLRTCCSDTDAIHYRDTVVLLRQLFERQAPTLLAYALDYALGSEATTVSQVYYSILSEWKQLTASSTPLNKRTMQARFLQLMADAGSLGMARYHRAPIRNELDWRADASMVRLAREEIRKLADVPADRHCTIPFGPTDRAACWLGLIPAMRNPADRKRILQRVAALAESGSGRVLQSEDENRQYRQTIDICRLMFVQHGDKVLVEMKIPGDGYVHVSLHLCGNTICTTGAR